MDSPRGFFAIIYDFTRTIQTRRHYGFLNSVSNNGDKQIAFSHGFSKTAKENGSISERKRAIRLALDKV